jgi:hypothetical protein
MVTSVAVRETDGQLLATGHNTNSQTGELESFIFPIAPDMSSFTTTQLGSLGGDTQTWMFSPNGEWVIHRIYVTAL